MKNSKSSRTLFKLYNNLNKNSRAESRKYEYTNIYSIYRDASIEEHRLRYVTKMWANGKSVA